MGVDLKGCRVLVTGGSSGIGAGLAEALAEAGAVVGICARRGDRLAEVVDRCMVHSPESRMWVVDLADFDAVDQLSVNVVDAFGGVDLLVNNAGLEHPYLLVDMPLQAWQKVIDVNLTGSFLCAREAARMMQEEGCKGAIVNISSVHEQIAWEQFSHYCASKGAVKMFAQSIAKELAPLGIRVVNVAPGAIDTPINKDVLASPEASATVQGEIPLGRWGHVQDIARAVAWLASEQASYVTGATLFVDGGMTLYPKFV